jgi:hypothetical protein
MVSLWPATRDFWGCGQPPKGGGPPVLGWRQSASLSALDCIDGVVRGVRMSGRPAGSGLGGRGGGTSEAKAGAAGGLQEQGEGGASLMRPCAMHPSSLTRHAPLMRHASRVRWGLRRRRSQQTPTSARRRGATSCRTRVSHPRGGCGHDRESWDLSPHSRAIFRRAPCPNLGIAIRNSCTSGE